VGRGERDKKKREDGNGGENVSEKRRREEGWRDHFQEIVEMIKLSIVLDKK
jgi:hypothetical protein